MLQENYTFMRIYVIFVIIFQIGFEDVLIKLLRSEYVVTLLKQKSELLSSCQMFTRVMSQKTLFYQTFCREEQWQYVKLSPNVFIVNFLYLLVYNLFDVQFTCFPILL